MRTVAAAVPQPTIGVDAAEARVESGRLSTATYRHLSGGRSRRTRSGTRPASPDAETSFGGQISRVRYFQGRLGEHIEPALQGASKPDSLTSWRALAALALIEGGRPDEARELVLGADFKGVRWDETWLMAMFTWARVCSRLRLRDRAAELYELLAPFAGQFVAGGSIMSGSVATALGQLARRSNATRTPRPTSPPRLRSRRGSARRCSSPTRAPTGPMRFSPAAGPRTSIARSTMLDRGRGRGRAPWRGGHHRAGRGVSSHTRRDDS